MANFTGRLLQNYKQLECKIFMAVPISTHFSLEAKPLDATPGWNWAKNQKQELSNSLRLSFRYLKIIQFLHSRNQPKIIGEIFNQILMNVIKLIYVSSIMKLYEEVKVIEVTKIVWLCSRVQLTIINKNETKQKQKKSKK